MIERIALKPCPFCGGEAMVYDCPDIGAIVNGTDPSPTSFHAACTNCDGGHPPSYSKEDAIAAWNNRTTELSAGDGVQECDRQLAEKILGLPFATTTSRTSPPVPVDRNTIAAGLAARHRTLAAAAERARRDKEIVAWLRGPFEALHGSGDYGRCINMIADAIEAGELS